MVDSMVNLQGNDINILEEALHTLDGSSVDMNICGCLSRLESIDKFGCWRDGEDNSILILSDENSENYWFLEVDDIKEWAVDSIIDGIDIVLNSGIEVEIYKN
jgi:hypothetical protein